MTIEELIEKLNSFEDKTLEVKVYDTGDDCDLVPVETVKREKSFFETQPDFIVLY